MSTAAVEVSEIRPQPGLQESFLSSPADIVIGGGAAGSGKTWALLVEPLRHIDNPNFGAVIFRRTYPQITNEGGLWDEAAELYDDQGGRGRESALEYTFPSGMTVKFAHLQHAKDREGWKGAQIPLIGFDQLEDFEERQFWYLLSRNRSARAGIKPYVRGTCNPVPESDIIGGWLHKLVSWWIDPQSGYAIPERAGKLRWFVRLANELYWADSAEELAKQFPDQVDHRGRGQKAQPKSLTFIPGSLAENEILESRDPGYRANLMALPLVERERLLRGNWKIKEGAGTIFKRGWFKTRLQALPTDVVSWVRYWDKAGTEGGGAFSAGALMGKRYVTIGDRRFERFLLADIQFGQWSARDREEIIKQTAESDRKRFGSVVTWEEQEPGSGGKESAQLTIKNLAGHEVYAERVTGDKITRARPLSAQAEAENVDLLDDSAIDENGVPYSVKPWNETFLGQAENFDGAHGFMDMIDAASGAFNKLTAGPPPVRQRSVVWG